MKKLALSSLLAVFAITSANAGNWFVGGGVDFDTAKSQGTTYGIAAEVGYHMNDKWDIGMDLGFEKYTDDTILPFEVNVREYDVAAFARYNVAQFGNFKVLLKGSAGADFTYYSAGDGDETETTLRASIIPMLTYDVSESFTLYANLNFLGVYANYELESDLRDDSWNFGFFGNSGDVANTGDFQIGFNYNF